MLGRMRPVSGPLFLLAMMAVPNCCRADDLTAARALDAAAGVLLGEPYGDTADKVKRNIKRQERVGADDPDCRAPAWKFAVSVPATQYNPEGIKGFLCLSPEDGTLMSAGLPYLD